MRVIELQRQADGEISMRELDVCERPAGRCEGKKAEQKACAPQPFLSCEEAWPRR